MYTNIPVGVTRVCKQQFRPLKRREKFHTPTLPQDPIRVGLRLTKYPVDSVR
jgi:hypothetical protein